MRRSSRLARTALAVLCIFTLGAGVTVARLLPRRLALWQPPGIAASHIVRSAQVLGSASRVPPSARATTAGVTRAITPVISSPVFGHQLGVVVTDLASGQVLYASHATAGFTPASTTKLATSIAAIRTLGPNARFATKVVAGPSANSIVLVGGGDPTLAAGPPPPTDYPQPATLKNLAKNVAQVLKARGRHSVQLGYDTSLYSGAPFAPGWPTGPGGYVATGNVSAITALSADQGRVTASGAPADNEFSSGPRATDPAAVAATAFANFLTADGVAVTGTPTLVAAPRRARTLSTVLSPPLTQVVQWMLEESNNVIAENLARHVAIATGRPATFAGAAAAVTAVLRGLGVSGVLSLNDGSGLSPLNQISPTTLVQLIRIAAVRPGLRSVLTGLPVEGFSGTLGLGGSVFGLGRPPGFGMVRAKTGNLSTAAALAGTAYAKNGQLLSFAIMADRIPAGPGALGAAATAMVNMASALAGCGCR